MVWYKARHQYAKRGTIDSEVLSKDPYIKREKHFVEVFVHECPPPSYPGAVGKHHIEGAQVFGEGPIVWSECLPYERHHDGDAPRMPEAVLEFCPGCGVKLPKFPSEEDEKNYEEKQRRIAANRIR